MIANAERTMCVKPPAPDCQCYEKYINDGTGCQACPYGLMSYLPESGRINSFADDEKKSVVRQRSQCGVEP
jgi:hypothetical protein